MTDNADDGGIIVLPGDDVSSSSDDSSDDSILAPGLDPGAGENSQGDVIDESVPDSTGDTVVIISPDDLAAILQGADSISLLADYGTSDVCSQKTSYWYQRLVLTFVYTDAIFFLR